MIVVDPEVTGLKLERELELWHENGGDLRRRGWILLGDGDAPGRRRVPRRGCRSAHSTIRR